jgi:peptidoglycan hydrolase-like protein with peptidoglycan-binding domain
MLALATGLMLTAPLLAAPGFAQAPATPAPMTPAPATPAPVPATPAPAMAAPTTATPAAPHHTMSGHHAAGEPNAAMRTQRVERLQTALNTNGAKLTVDGKFGPKTKSALMDFQKAHGLKVTGHPDKETIAALKG